MMQYDNYTTNFKIFLFFILILFMFFYNVNSAANSPGCESVNVKTVLWKQIDACRKCWGKQDVLKLYARRIVQDLIPRRVPRNIPLLLQYLTICWEQIPRSTPEGSMERYILTLVLADTIGGYLQTVALPIANEAYYAGNVDYKVMAQLYYLFEELKMELGTDGGGWSKPCDMKRIPTRVAALDLSEMGDDEDVNACKELHIPSLSKKPRAAEGPAQNLSTPLPHSTTGKPGFTSKPNQLCNYASKIPFPFLDDDQHPNAIAVPVKDQLLYSLHAMNSAHILVRYYITAMKCIGKKDKKTLLEFNHYFYQWVISNVVPHLHEKNKWYVGFGSVMRIVETMHQRGWIPEIMPTDLPHNRPDTIPTVPPLPKSTTQRSGGPEFGILLKLIPVLLLLLLLLLFICCVVCILRRAKSSASPMVPFMSLYYRMRKGKTKEENASPKDFEDDDDNVTGATINTERDSNFSVKDGRESDDTTTATSETDERVPRKQP